MAGGVSVGDPGRHVRGRLPWTEQGLPDSRGQGQRQRTQGSGRWRGWLASPPPLRPRTVLCQVLICDRPQSVPDSESPPGGSQESQAQGMGWLTFPQARNTLCLSVTLT